MSIWKQDVCLYFNHRPVYVSIKTVGVISIFRDVPYEQVEEKGYAIVASAHITSDNGSEFLITDTYQVAGGDLVIARNAEIQKKVKKNLSFQTKIGFWMYASDQVLTIITSLLANGISTMNMLQ